MDRKAFCCRPWRIFIFDFPSYCVVFSFSQSLKICFQVGKFRFCQDNWISCLSDLVFSQPSHRNSLSLVPVFVASQKNFLRKPFNRSFWWKLEIWSLRTKWNCRYVFFRFSDCIKKSRFYYFVCREESSISLIETLFSGHFCSKLVFYLNKTP